MTYIIDKQDFMRIKTYLDGGVFWREVDTDRVEIKLINKSLKTLIDTLKNKTPQPK